MNRLKLLLLSSALAFVSQAAYADTCIGTCGTMGANGVVTASPLGGDYNYVSTVNGVYGTSPFNLGGETNGSKFTTSSFSANAGSELNFYFNFVTSDGAGYADYAWARLLNASDNSQAALLFTARTKPSGNIIPGQGMPTPDAAVPTATIIGGGPAWSALGGSSGTCYNAGCGYTGWVLSSFTIAAAGNYLLEFGTVNWADTAYQTGMAFDGITVDGKPIDTVPLPAALPLMATGLAAFGVARRRSKK